MKLTTVKEIYKNREEYLDREITVGGWVRSVRDSKTFGFIVLHDGTFFETLQIVYHDTMANFAEISKLNVGAAIIVKGTLVATPQAKQPFEIQASEVTLEGASAPDYPLQKKRHTLEYLRTMTHLRARTNTFQAVFRVRSLCAYAIHQFFQDRGFVYVHTPLITGSDCEGAGEMFRVTTLDAQNPPLDDKGNVDYSKDFFGKETNLTVSGQLNAETYAQAFRNVYTFGPTFRAENSNTTRHAAEFWMIEPECAFADLNDNMDLAESMLKYVIGYVLENAPEEMKFFNSFVDKRLLERLKHVMNSEFAHVTYTEAVKLLEKNNDKFDYKVFWGCDLQTEHERYLTEVIFKKPVFVTDYPKEIKAFYMKLNEDGKTVAAMDCLVPGIGEIIGGSQREDDFEKLTARMKELGLKAEDYAFYTDLRKYGSTRHSGYGLGFERMIMYLTGMGNIRDVIPFPRTVNNCEL
ncbi:MAG: asparagine--tRNA ligase [Eubacteriales bacterium]|nr:asparagine--tRNA ligase [Eubacteriales bacterium]